MNNKILSALFFSLVLTTQFYAQSPFKASMLMGVNLSQVDGDLQKGYFHKGINIGIRGGYSVNKRLDMMSELIYQEKGVKAEDDVGYISGKSLSIDLKYAEIPFTINYHSKPNAEGFYNWTFHTGLSYGRLLNAKTNASYSVKIDSTKEENLSRVSYNPHEWAFVWGVSYNFRSHFGLRFQHSFSLNKFYTNPLPKPAYDPRYNDFSYRSFRNYFVSMQLFYDFFAPKYKINKVKKATHTSSKDNAHPLPEQSKTKALDINHFFKKTKLSESISCAEK